MADIASTAPGQAPAAPRLSLRGALSAAEVDFRLFGMLIALAIWAALIVSGGADQGSVLTLLAAWLSPDSVTGWIFYGVLCVPCSWLMYRLPRLWFPDAG